MSRNRSVLHCAALAFGLLITADSASAQSNFPIRNRASGLVADVVGAQTNDGQPVILFKKNGNPNQLFFQAVETDDTFSLVAVHSSKCLDVAGFSQLDGADVIQFACHRGTNQRWTVQHIGGGIILKSVNSGKCLDARNGKFPRPPGSGAPLQQWACILRASDPNAVNQIFTLGSF
jgi:hypothetical protein